MPDRKIAFASMNSLDEIRKALHWLSPAIGIAFGNKCALFSLDGANKGYNNNMHAQVVLTNKRSASMSATRVRQSVSMPSVANMYAAETVVSKTALVWQPGNFSNMKMHCLPACNHNNPGFPLRASIHDLVAFSTRATLASTNHNSSKRLYKPWLLARLRPLRVGSVGAILKGEVAAHVPQLCPQR